MSAPGRRVLVCDDELQILRALKVVLREAGFEVVATATAQEALDAAALRPPDAAIIDLMLPDGDGVEVCRELRAWSEMPILVLSAVGEEDQKVAALEAGADDYVTKPFGPRELVARLQGGAAPRGRGGRRADDRVDGLEIDLAARVVRRDGAEVHLTPIEYDLLRVLARNRGRLMTHRALLDRGLGPGVRRRHARAAHPHRQPAAQDRAGRRAALHPHRRRRRLPLRGEPTRLHTILMPGADLESGHGAVLWIGRSPSASPSSRPAGPDRWSRPH